MCKALGRRGLQEAAEAMPVPERVAWQARATCLLPNKTEPARISPCHRPLRSALAGWGSAEAE